jgi:hypothetical protein
LKKNRHRSTIQFGQRRPSLGFVWRFWAGIAVEMVGFDAGAGLDKKT